MKRFILMVLFVLCVSSAYGQTYYYKYVCHVEKNTGAKSKMDAFVKEHGFYITFTNGKSYCYRSDANGIKTQYSDTHKYIGNDNGRLTYYFSYRDSGNPFMQNYPKSYYYFSSDYSRLNMWSDCSDMGNLLPLNGGEQILVYKLSTPPTPTSNAPDQLW